CASPVAVAVSTRAFTVTAPVIETRVTPAAPLAVRACPIHASTLPETVAEELDDEHCWWLLPLGQSVPAGGWPMPAPRRPTLPSPETALALSLIASARTVNVAPPTSAPSPTLARVERETAASVATVEPEISTAPDPPALFASAESVEVAVTAIAVCALIVAPLVTLAAVVP